MAKKKLGGLNAYLDWYYTNCQKNIVLVYRGSKEESWARRCMYLDPKYSPKVNYNHRSIMDCEIVIEYDTDNKELNMSLADRAIAKLRKAGIDWAQWGSGNKSFHVHSLFKIPTNVQNLPLLKTVIMKYFGEFYLDEKTNTVYDSKSLVPGNVEATRILPDLRLASSHLIRAEFGLHEKSQGVKSLIRASSNAPCLSLIPAIIWEHYERAQKNSIAIRMGQQTKDLYKSDIVKMLTDTVQFKENMDDGRERVMFALIHILKPQYKDVESLSEFLYEWYSYSSNQAPQMSYVDVRNKVKYHWSKSYNISESFLRRLIEEVSGKTWDELQSRK
jgi:hypothetical protein